VFCVRLFVSLPLILVNRLSLIVAQFVILVENAHEAYAKPHAMVLWCYFGVFLGFGVVEHRLRNDDDSGYEMQPAMTNGNPLKQRLATRW
jgi:hypothetical protein